MRFVRKDLLEDLYANDYRSLVAEIAETSKTGKRHVIGVYFACKGGCDRTLERRAYERYKAVTVWEDISDIAMPNQFLRWIMAFINQLRHDDTYSDEAFDREKHLIIAICQKVFREVTESERERLQELVQWFG